MKVLLSLCCLIALSFSSVLTHASEINSSCSNIPQGEWDWTLESSYNHSDTQYPFSDHHIIGSNLTGFYCPEDGWLLYSKKLTCADIHKDDEVCKVQDKRPSLPYFSLYNKYTGLLKFFIWVPTNPGNLSGSDSMSFSIRTLRGSSQTDDIALLTNSENPLRPLTEVDMGPGQITTSIIPTTETGVWAIVDYYLTYPGEDQEGTDLAFGIDVHTQNTQTIEMTGKITGKLSTITPGTDRSVLDIIGGTLSEGETIVEAYEDAEGWYKKLKQKGQEWSDPSKNDFQREAAPDLLSLGSLLEDNKEVVGGINAVVAGYGIVKGLMGSKDSIKHQYVDLDVSLDGLITDENSALKHVNVSVHNSPQFNDDATDADKSELNFDGALGLFHFKRAPRILLSGNTLDSDQSTIGFGYRLNGRLGDDLASLIEINPAVSNEMKMVELKVTPVATLKLTLPTSNRSYNGILWRSMWDRDRRSDPVDGGFGFYELSCPNKETKVSRTLTRHANQDGYGSSYNRPKGIDTYSMCNTYVQKSMQTIKLSDEVVTLGQQSSNAPQIRVNRDITVQFNELASPASSVPFSFDLRQRYASNYGEDDWPGSYHGYSVQDIKYKVFVKFQHKDREDIYLDYVGYLQPELYLCDRSFDEWNNHIFDQKLSMNNYQLVSKSICQGSFDSDGDSMKDKDEAKYGLSVAGYDDPNADYDNDGLSNIREIANGLNPTVANPAGMCLLDTSTAAKLWMDKTGSAPPLQPIFASDTSPMQNGDQREATVLLLNGGQAVAGETMNIQCDNGQVNIEPANCQLSATDLWQQKYGTTPPRGLSITNGTEMDHGTEKGVTVRYKKSSWYRSRTLYRTINTSCNDGTATAI